MKLLPHPATIHLNSRLLWSKTLDRLCSQLVEIMEITIPTGFKKDTWVTSIEIRPGNRSVVHHADVFIVPHEKGVKYGVPDAAVAPLIGGRRTR